VPPSPTFDRRIKLEYGARITSDGGLLACRELEAALGLTEIAITQLLDGRRGKKARHTLAPDCFDSRSSAVSPATRTLAPPQEVEHCSLGLTRPARSRTVTLTVGPTRS
jgi:hypothetical protein